MAPGLQCRALFKEMVTVVTEERAARLKEIARIIWREPFARAHVVGTLLPRHRGDAGGPRPRFVVVTLGAGVVLAVTFFGSGHHRRVGPRVPGNRRVASSAGSRSARRGDRRPRAVRLPPGLLWAGCKSALRDRTGWRSMAYVVIKVPLAILGILVAFSHVVGRLLLSRLPDLGRATGTAPPSSGCPSTIFGQGSSPVARPGSSTSLAIFLVGVLLFFAAPWAVRAVVYLDRRVMRVLLAPDALTARVRSLEQARAQTVDTSAATLRRIERDLHDGTQAQLVALAMRLGMAKEKLEDRDHVDLDQVRRLVDDAHSGAKEAIVELRDLARGIHPPALDIGLEGALSTLAARCTVPTEITLALDRPPDAGHRVHRLLLRGRAPGQRRPTRPGVAGQHHLHRGRRVVADGRARRREGRGSAVTPRLVLERVGRPDRPRARRRRSPRAS